MKAIFLFPALLFIAACDVPNNSTRTSASGGVEIQLQDGRNCWDNKCLSYNPRRGTFSISDRQSVAAPAGAIKSGGYMSVSAFQQTFDRALRAPSRGGYHL